MADVSILFAGFGGQGVLFAGKVAAYAGLISGKQVSWLPSYGPEMRGGTANCGVCLSDKPVGSPLVTAPDVLVAMNGPSYDKFVGALKPGGIVVYDSSIIHPKKEREDVKVFALPATRISGEENLSGIAGMILLGKMFKESAIAGIDTVVKAVRKAVPAAKNHMVEHNLRAIKLGMERE